MCVLHGGLSGVGMVVGGGLLMSDEACPAGDDGGGFMTRELLIEAFCYASTVRVETCFRRLSGGATRRAEIDCSVSHLGRSLVAR